MCARRTFWRTGTTSPSGTEATNSSTLCAGAKSVSHVDGLSVEFDNWRFNLRMSNTEPVVRLNVEARGDKALMEAKTEELLEEMKRLNV